MTVSVSQHDKNVGEELAKVLIILGRKIWAIKEWLRQWLHLLLVSAEERKHSEVQ